MTDTRRFLEAYERVRAAEGWGGDDLDLPFHPKRHHDIWAVRRRTFEAFATIARPLAPGLAVDVGAGPCWLTRYLSSWGFRAVAVDINRSAADGLVAGRAFIREGVRFDRVCASMDQLPFTSGQATLVVANASFHYARDFEATLRECVRVLASGGTLAILDTPMYQRPADGDRMVAERAVAFRREYGIEEDLACWSRFLTPARVSELAAAFDVTTTIVPVWPGPRRTLAALRARLRGRRVARFPIVVFTKR